MGAFGAGWSAFTPALSPGGRRGAAAFPGSHVATRADTCRDGSETQRVQGGNGARAHCEDVAYDAPDAGRRALKRFDRAGMIVGLDLEGDSESVANVDDAGVFLPGADENFFRLRGEGLEQGPRVLVGAMLAPHDREDAQLCVIRFAPEDLLDSREFTRCQTVLFDQVGSDGGIGHQKSGGWRKGAFAERSVTNGECPPDWSPTSKSRCGTGVARARIPENPT